MKTIKDLLDRGDLVGGEIQGVIKEKPTTRSKILRVELSRRGEVVFFLGKTVILSDDCHKKWKRVRSLKKLKFIGSIPTTDSYSPQFDVKGGWYIIFPSGDRSVIR